MENDEMELDTIGDEKTVLFLIMSDTDTTFNFILAMLQSQLINLLCDRADDKYGGRLPVHVRLILDEFANIGQIPNFDKLIATIRSREISASIILQSQSQLKAIYKDAAEIISDNCDSVLFLSGRGKNAKEMAAPNSPDKKHFMVEVSPYFTKLASSRDTDQLLAMLPYKSLHLSSVKDRFGIYALIDKNENRDKNIRKPRASIRKQLSETKQAASPKKAAAHRKQYEMEV